jgi:hypothetical protein
MIGDLKIIAVLKAALCGHQIYKINSIMGSLRNICINETGGKLWQE